ncbi:MAG: hypothetical protein KGI83_02780, partial [Verrucomicrobiota bacterium]|nr:hypothetical protein [Verrucomicrobiota bacterium]
GFDPNSASNTPWVHSIQTGNGKTCTILRHGTPTVDDASYLGLVKQVIKQVMSWDMKATTVIPEYRAHLAVEPRKHTLYVNHQVHGDLQQPMWLAKRAEVERSCEIQGLEKNYPNFHFLSLPMDGTIWKIKATELKPKLLDLLLNQKDGFALPQGIDLEAFKKDADAIFESVHRLYFKGAIGSEERKKAFIMLFYSEIKDYFKGKLNADFIVSACKDNKDRGNASTGVDMMKNFIKLGKENDPERLKEMFFLTLAPFVIKNEAILPDRLELLLNVIDVLQGLTAEEKEAIRQDCTSGFSITDQKVPKEPVSWSQMVGPKQFVTLVENMRALGEKRVILKNLVPDRNLDCVRTQIERDLPRMDIRIDGDRMLTWAAIYKRLRGDLTLLSALHQGTAAIMMEDPARYFQRDDYTVAQRELSSDRQKVIGIIGNPPSVPNKEGSPEFKHLLYSAVTMGLLSPEWLPEGRFDTPPLPIYPTRISYATKTDTLAADIELVLKSPEGWSVPIDVHLSKSSREAPATIVWEMPPPKH